MADDNSEVIVAAAALVVSVIAFAATLLQCLQQYYASARGYSQCNEKVIGEWAKTKTRRFSLEELRFEVQFDAPVIFLCPPTNTNAPVPDADMYKLDGTDESLAETWTTLNMSQRKDYQKRSPKERIHTSDNERASWTILLSAVQCMERESREWHEAEFEYDPDQPPRDVFRQHGLPHEPPSLESSHTLVVALQRKRKSWDTMPAAITRPYATTTMCHLVEVMAAMGIYWKEFNRRIDRYRAEGNGFMVLGERFSDLGLMFNFQVNGLSRFGRNRVIPVDEIKELCFGWVPTIYRSTQDKRRLEVPIDLLDLSSLQMATRSEVAETLVMIGCNNNAVNCFLEEGRRTSHLFPISFEILGMLSQTFHIENTYFTYIPNPTSDRWDSRSVSLAKMMEAFQQLFVADLPDGSGRRNQYIVNRLDHHMSEVLSHQGDSNVERLLRFRALHAALDDADEILTGRTKTSRSPPTPSPPEVVVKSETRRSEVTGNLRRRLTAMAGLQPSSPSWASGNSAAQRKKSSSSSTQAAKPPPGLSPETPAQRARREKVQDVLRSHIQEVLRLLNEREDGGRYLEHTLPVPPRWTRARSRSVSPSPLRDTPTMDEVDAAGPENRQDTLMQVYCLHIRRLVVQNAAQTAGRRMSLRTPGSRGSRGSRATETSSPSATQDDDGVPVAAVQSQPQPLADGAVPDMEADEAGGGPEQPASSNRSLAYEEVHHDDIWCTLVFRMICWLMLHDFNKLDVQVPKSELLGSRMPVYVA